MSSNPQEWHDWRRQGVGSSDAPILMRVAPKDWGTPFELWEEKYLGKTQDKDNYAMKYGRDNEERARCEFERVMGVMVAPKPVIHASMPWIRANLDGIDMDDKIMVEIKCPGMKDHSIAVSKNIPEKYYPQCQHQLLATGLNGMYYFSFYGNEGVVVEVERDQEYIDKLFEKEAKFWDHVLKGVPPELTEDDYICMENNKNWKILSTELRWIREEKMSLEEREEECLEALKNLCQRRNAKGNHLKLKKQICDGAIDYSKVPELQGIDLEIYRKKSFEKWTPRFIS